MQDSCSRLIIINIKRLERGLNTLSEEEAGAEVTPATEEVEGAASTLCWFLRMPVTSYFTASGSRNRKRFSSASAACFLQAIVATAYILLSISTKVSAAACSNSGGLAINDAACTCGDVECTVDTGLLCEATTSSCTPIQNCTITNGSSANTLACHCGSETCNVLTGFICYSTRGGGSCRKTGLGAFGYLRTNVGLCSSRSGRKLIGDKRSCEAAALSMGFGEKMAITTSGPQGCRVITGLKNQLEYNPNPSSRLCSHAPSYGGYCICIAASNCVETDATTSNAAPCVCGLIGCTISSGLYCELSTSTCSRGNTCLNADGAIINSIACACGETACSAFNGMYCYAEASQCSHTAFENLCLIRNGSAVNSGECQCGLELCTEATGLVCYSEVGSGSCRKRNFGQFGYPRPGSGSGWCNSVSGRKWILDQASCDIAAASMGLIDVTTTIGGSTGYPRGCFMSTGNNLMIGYLNSDQLCSNVHSLYCICMSAPDCANTDGTAVNNAPCLCGQAGCANADTGLLCNATTSTCTPVQNCTVTNGLMANPVPCYCGSETCDALTGLICYTSITTQTWDSEYPYSAQALTSTNQGSCRTFSPGSFGYPRRKSGMCTDNNGMGLIADKTSCEAAAASMGLSDTSAEELTWVRHRPKGCFYLDSKLYFKTNNAYNTYNGRLKGRSGTCKNTDFCLCAISPNCVHTDGKTTNEVQCICGKTECSTSTGFYCYSINVYDNEKYYLTKIDSSRCSPVPIPVCTNINGASINTGPCSCGAVTCDATTGLFCYANGNTCGTIKMCVWSAEVQGNFVVPKEGCKLGKPIVLSTNPGNILSVHGGPSLPVVRSSYFDGADLSLRPRRHFVVYRHNELHLSSLTLSGGRVGLEYGNSELYSGSIDLQAGILYLTNVTITGCGKGVTCASECALLINGGRAYIVGSTFVSNRYGSGAMYMYNNGRVHIEKSNFTLNSGVIQIGNGLMTLAGGENIFSQNIVNIRYRYSNADYWYGTNFTTCPPSTFAPITFPPVVGTSGFVFLHNENFKGCPYTCPPGTHAPGYKMRQSSKWCSKCPAGYYNPDPHLHPTCLFCPGSKSTPSTGATSINDCTGVFFFCFDFCYNLCASCCFVTVFLHFVCFLISFLH